jgi:uncharacterized protein
MIITFVLNKCSLIMPRPKRIRRVCTPPHFKGYLPIGLPDQVQAVVLNYEEYEAIRLSDYELHGQVEAAEIMGVSRPTYARVYESARRKIAEALVGGKPIIFEGGKVYFDSDWYTCLSCNCWFNHLEKEKPVQKCALCGSTHIEPCKVDEHPRKVVEICACLNCGYEEQHQLGMPCRKCICPKCGQKMVHNGMPQNRRGRMS